MNQRDEYYRRKEEEMKAFVKRNKGKVIGGAAVLGTAATLALGSIAGQHDIDPDNGKIDIVIPGIEQPIQIPDIGGQVGDIISGVDEDIPIDTSLDPDYFGDKTIDPLPIVTPRDPEEIAATGVTAQDILDLLDMMTLNMYKYPRTSKQQSYGEYWNQITSQWNYTSTNNDLPVCKKVLWFTPDEINFSPAHKNEEPKDFTDVYLISFNYTTGLGDRGITSNENRYAITAKEYEALMKAYNNTPYEFTEQDLSRYQNNEQLEPFVGQIVYDKILFDRDTIKNSNQQQLDIWYVILNGSLKTINFENNLKDNELTLEK